jgi:predicted transcriptional regulator
MASAPFSLRLDPEVRRRLDEEARRVERPASQVAERAIVRYLEAQEAFREMIDAAVAEADTGVFISDTAMHRWMESWDTDRELPLPEPDIFPPDRQ